MNLKNENIDHSTPSVYAYRRWRSLAIYSLALIITIATFYLRQALAASFGDRPLLIIFLLPIIFSALLGGLGPGILATVVAAACSDYFIFPPNGSFIFEARHDLIQWSMLIINGVLVSVMSESLHRSRQRETARWQQVNAIRNDLEQTETLFQNTFELAAVGIALVGLDGRWLQVNYKLCNIVGYSREELLALTFQDITFADDLHDDLNHVNKLLSGDCRNYTLEKRYKHKNGSLIWINLTVTLVWNSDATPSYFIAVIEDIQARKRAESALKNSEAALLQAQTLAGIGNWRWESETDTHTWSNAIYDIYGRDPALPPAHYSEVQKYFTPESWNRLSAAVEDAKTKGSSYECDAEVVRPDGSRRWTVTRGGATLDSNGKVIDLYGTVQDITKRKQLEENLKKFQAQLVTFIKHAPIAIAMFDRNMNYLVTSGRWLLEWGCGYADLTGQNHYEVLPDVPDEWKLIHQQGLSGVTLKNDNDLWIHSDGSKHWLRWAVQPWTDENGAIGGIIISAEDITDRMQAEEEVRHLNLILEQRVTERTEELTAANRELDSFAYAVSHDLRAPLRAMSGFSQALLEDYGGQLQGEAQIYLEQIGLASKKMGELIDGLLVLSRTTRSKLQYNETDLSALSRRLLNELALTAPERRVTVHIEPGLTVLGDARMIELIMQNLLSNAWKYTAQTEAADIRVYSAVRDGVCRFCVADNGAGFDMAHANRLFQPFQRLHRQDEFPGIGIGLATVQRIVHRHGGTIEAKSEPGKGAEFSFTLPNVPGSDGG